jgi:hypothetical protein
LEAKEVTEPDLTYEEARRKARALLGSCADIFWVKGKPFPVRVVVWVGLRHVLVGVGDSFREALQDVKTRQEILK